MRITDLYEARKPVDEDLWHGSPHNFDRFSTDHLGTGDGEQIHGWGLYFTVSQRLADDYKVGLAQMYGKPGKLYKVEVKRDEADFLDLEQPLTRQSSRVWNVLQKIDFIPPERFTGADIYAACVKRFGSEKAASQALSAAGLAGSRYTDEDGRYTTEGGACYVIFNAADITLLGSRP
jgi:hypothetical protein